MQILGDRGKSVPAYVVGVSSFVIGRDEMPSVPLLQGCRGAGETGTEAVCISAAWERREVLWSGPDMPITTR